MWGCIYHPRSTNPPRTLLGNSVKLDSQRPPALILGGRYTGLGVARSLGACGIRAVMAAPAGDFARRSRFVRLAVDACETGEAPSVLDAVRAARVDRAVLVPCTDLWCEAVASLALGDATELLTSMPPQTTTSVLVDKGLLSETLRSLSIPCPQTFSVEKTDDLAFVGNPGKTWILKPRSSQRFNRIFQRKAFVVRDRHEAQKKLEACLRSGAAMVLQEYVPGPPTAHVFVDGFVDRSGVVRAQLARRRLRLYPRDVGNSSSGVSIGVTEIPDAVHSVSKLLRALRYRGIFSAELKHDPEEGTYKLLEVNARAYWYVDFARRCGVNLSLMAYRDALGEPVETASESGVGRAYGFVVEELRALADERRRGELSYRALAVGLAHLGKLPVHPNDPLPAVSRLAGATLRRIVPDRGCRSRRQRLTKDDISPNWTDESTAFPG